MEARRGAAFAGTEQLIVVGRPLHAGDRTPDFRLDCVDLTDLAVRTISLADSTGVIRLLSVVNNPGSPHCQHVIRQWETFRGVLSAVAAIYTVCIDPPQMQARWQDTVGLLHQILSAHRSEHFGQDYGVWLKEWR